MTDMKRPELETADLKTGDLLLSLSDSEIGKLVAWLGSAKYSHAAVVFDATRLIEATPPQVQLAALDERVRKQSIRHIDVLRPRAAFSPEDEALLRAHGELFVGRDYATDLLAPLAMAAIARKATRFHPVLHGFLKWVIQHEISSTSDKLVCTELAYRLYNEPRYGKPRAPQLPDLPVVTLPVPLLHPVKLAREIQELFGQSADRAGALAAGPFGGATAEALEGILGELEALGEDETALAPQPLLQSPDERFDAHCAALWNQWSAGVGNAAVNPKTVLLLELFQSPSFQHLGRLRKVPAGV